MPHALTIRLREIRARAGWSASGLARAVGLSRQAYAAIEAGRAVPSTETALRLAHALDTHVEALFQLLPEGGGASVPQRTRRIEVGGREVALPLTPCHGLPAAGGSGGPGGRARPVVAVAGCDPATTVLAELVGARHDVELVWAASGSTASIERLGRGEVHVAGSHLPDTEARVAAAVPFPCEIVHVAVWQQGLVVRPGNPLDLRDAGDLARPGVRIVNREEGSGSRRLLQRRMDALGVSDDALRGFDTAARGHLAVADAVAAGLAHAGVAIRAAADALGLGFVPWEEEPYRLVIPRHLLVDDPGVAALLDVLRAPGTREHVEALGGYDGEGMGSAA